MAYKIRYGIDRYRWTSLGKVMRYQILISAGLLLLTGLALLWEGEPRWLEGAFYGQPLTATERAVCAFSDSLACGDGWYRALLVWCRTIIDAGAV